MPSMSGRPTSRGTTSGRVARRGSIAAAPPPAASTSMPSSSSSAASPATTAASSSTISSRRAAIGTKRWNVVPAPGVLSAKISPPWRCTTWCATASPRPVPVHFVVKSGSKMWRSVSSDMPAPVSRTVTWAKRPSRRPATAAVPPPRRGELAQPRPDREDDAHELRGPREAEDLRGDALAAADGAGDLIERLGRAFRLAADHFDERRDAHEHVVELVRDRGREAAEAGDAVSLLELLLQLAALGDVVDDHDDAHHRVAVDDRRGRVIDRQRRPVGAPEDVVVNRARLRVEDDLAHRAVGKRIR